MSKKILIVDDDPVLLNLMGNYIGYFGHEYSTAANGLEAKEKLEKETFGIVITDMMMPKMDGMQLLQHIRATYPRTNVIVITGYDRTFTYTDVIKAGASDFIAKPFNADELEAKLKRVLREQELVSQLELLSISDPLTNIYNRRHFDVKIEQEVQRAHRQGYDIFLGLADIDNFKQFNDQFGHQAGDRLLQTVATILKDSIRVNVDWAFRYGGDEFGFVITQISAEQASKTAERIIQKYEEQDFPGSGISIGIAKLGHQDNGQWAAAVNDLISRADRALYAAKDQGRGQIVFDKERPGLNSFLP